ncbi:MAG TPA: MerR family transcriptional regulator [Nocardioidaceae bacterium]
MFTIKQAAERTGTTPATLRAWEKRYGVGTSHRTESGYRLYDDRAIAALTAMRRLVDDGWTPASAAGAVGEAAPEVAGGSPEPTRATPAAPPGQELTDEFLEAAARVDAAGVDSVLDRAFASAPFETVTDTWLMPTLWALGEAWAEGRVDVAGEHTASHAVMRRLAHDFAAASPLARGPRVVVGLPAGSHHELGALAFATAARRSGLAVVYVGADLPLDSWLRAVRAFPTRAAVIAVPTADDRDAAARTAEALLRARPDLVVAAGGGHSQDLAPGVLSLPHSITAAVGVLRDR